MTHVVPNPDLGGLLSSAALDAMRQSAVAQAVSEQTRFVTDKIFELRNPTAPSEIAKGGDEVSLEDRLFDASAAAKQMIASVSMHIDTLRRARLYKQLDSMHTVEEWNEGDVPLSIASFESFLRTLFLLSPSRLPSLGLTHDGHLLAAWTQAQDQLVIEFLPSRRVRWSLARTTDSQTERAAGENAISRLRSVLSPYEPERWFFA